MRLNLIAIAVLVILIVGGYAVWRETSESNSPALMVSTQERTYTLADFTTGPYTDSYNSAMASFAAAKAAHDHTNECVYSNVAASSALQLNWNDKYAAMMKINRKLGCPAS